MAVALLLLVIATGVLGYAGIEGWSAFDALYMTIITLATVGYSEIHPLSQTGRAFTIGLIVAGRIAEAYVIVVFAQAVVVEQVRDILGRRRMQKGLAQLQDHYIICGWGRMGQEIVEEFRGKHVPHVVIEISEEKCRRLGDAGVLYVQGDATDDQTLRRAGVERARGLIAVAPKDADNIFITLSARSLSKELFIVTRCAYEQDIHKLRVAGANRVISPYVIGARRIAAAAFHPTVVDFLDQEVHREDMDWELEDIPVTEQAFYAGKALSDCGIRERTGCTVLAVRDAATQRFHSNPPPQTLLNVGDTLIVLGAPRQLEQLESLAALPPQERRARTIPRVR
ncbi:MAG TPA: NAD-binding protein [Armatimonadota bacterium]|nr:NAD-binding protein [Armatimonadota bacterium]